MANVRKHRAIVAVAVAASCLAAVFPEVSAQTCFCAITGGRYAVVERSGAADEQGTCAPPCGKACDADVYYACARSR